MKLYYSPGACSLAPHLLLEQLGLDYEAVPVRLDTHTYAGGDYYQVNPKGSVPALDLDEGGLLTENAVILQYLADRRPEAGLLPPAGTLDRYRALEWVNFIATELHKNFGPLFNPRTPEDYKTIARENIAKKLGFVADHLAIHPFLTGPTFGVPDAYLFVILTWANRMRMEAAGRPELIAFFDRVKALPATRRALAAEGLA